MGSVHLNENLETFPMTVCANAHVYVRARLSMYKNLDDIHISFFLSLPFSVYASACVRKQTCKLFRWFTEATESR